MKILLKIAVFGVFFGLFGSIFAASQLRTVVIDAGHGGQDAGAVGKFAKEKDINLAVALAFGKMIESNFSDINVYYTRSTDESVDLWKRPRIANKQKADLFISIHCNSSEIKRGMPYPKGFETFVMGLHKSDENLAVARKENAAIFSEENYADAYEGFNPNSPEAYIIFSLYQSAYLDQSLNFASRLQTHYNQHLTSIDRGVKQAGFLVLHGTTMPSVLTEIGFINNPEEETFIASAEGQEKVVTALFNAFKEYKYALDGFNNQSPISIDKSSETPENSSVSNDANNGANGAFANGTHLSATPENTTVSDTSTPTNQNHSTATDNLSTPDSTAENQKPVVVYKVQFASSTTDKPLTAKEFRHIETPGKYYHQGSYKFTAGELPTMEAATALQRKMQQQGYRDAFVVVFKDNQRITPEEALRLIEN